MADPPAEEPGAALEPVSGGAIRIPQRRGDRLLRGGIESLVGIDPQHPGLVAALEREAALRSETVERALEDLGSVARRDLACRVPARGVHHDDDFAREAEARQQRLEP